MIHLTYHLKDKYITASKKDFFKAAEDRKGNEIVMTPEMCITYQVWRKTTYILKLFYITRHKGKVKCQQKNYKHDIFPGVPLLHLHPFLTDSLQADNMNASGGALLCWKWLGTQGVV